MSDHNHVSRIMIIKEELIHRVMRAESTNGLAMDQGLKGAPAGTVIVADTQTKGRGRLHREWFSPPGTGLYFSIIMRPQLAVHDLPKISLAAAVAVCEAIARECHVSPGIKWPNDLLLDDRKFGGILCETGPVSGPDGSGSTLVVLGIGLNVNTPAVAFPEKLRAIATSLLACSGHEYDREAVLAAVLAELSGAVARLEHGEYAWVLDRWRDRDVLIGRRLSWLDPAGSIVTGEALGIDDHGLYHIRDKTGRVHEVVSGDISLAGVR